MPPLADPLTPAERHHLPDGLARALSHFRSPALTADTAGVPAAYALLPELGPFAKPVIQPSLAALARLIHRRRGRDALQLRPARLFFRDRAREVTEVLALDETSGRTTRIGFAWHAGRPVEALQRALEAELPAHAVEG